jgi:hypothetical protein
VCVYVCVCVCVCVCMWKGKRSKVSSLFTSIHSFLYPSVAVKSCIKQEAAMNFLREIETMKQLSTGLRCGKIVRFHGITLMVSFLVKCVCVCVCVCMFV